MADTSPEKGNAAMDGQRTYMTDEQAERWAWEQVKRDVGTEGWTAGDSCTYYGFFLWGWRYKGQYLRQRATPPSPSTAPEELKRLQLNHGLLEVSFEQVKARAQQADARILELEAALASRPAEVGDDPPQWWHELQAAAEALDDAGAPLNAESVRKIAEQYRQGQRDAVAADRARRGDINPEDAFVLYSAADVIDECGKVLVALKVRGIADRVIMPEITKAPR